MKEKERERGRNCKEATCVKKITLTPRGQCCHGNTAPAFKSSERVCGDVMSKNAIVYFTKRFHM